MKRKLSISLDNLLIQQVKCYALRHQISMSQLVEQYFKNLIRSTHRKNIVQLVEQLPKPAIDNNTNLKAVYYKDQQKKYDF